MSVSPIADAGDINEADEEQQRVDLRFWPFEAASLELDLRHKTDSIKYKISYMARYKIL